MTPGSPPQAVRRYQNRPLYWGLAAVVVAASAWANLMAAEQRQQRKLARAQRVVATVDSAYKGGSLVPVRYHNPVTDQTIDVKVAVFAGDLLPKPNERVDVLVAPEDPEEVSFVGDRYSYGFDAISLAVIALIPIVFWLLRVRGIARLRRTIEEPGPSFAMLGALGPAGRWSRCPQLHLYPLDAAPGARPLCSVAILDHGELPVGSGAFPVEVKGFPRPFGRLVAKAGDVVLWPAGRASLAGKAPLCHEHSDLTARLLPAAPPAPRTPGWPWRAYALELVAAAAGVAVLGAVVVSTVVGSRDSRAMADRAVHVVAEIVRAESGDSHVELRYRLPGEAHERGATAPVDFAEDYKKGRRYPVLVDPKDLSRARTAEEPYNAFGPVLWALAALPIACWPLGSRARAWRAAQRVVGAGPWRHVQAWLIEVPPHRPRIGLATNADAPSAVVTVSEDDGFRLTQWSSVRLAGRLAPGEPVALAIDNWLVLPIGLARAPRANDLRR